MSILDIANSLPAEDFFSTFPWGSKYAGIGSRRTPPDILQVMIELAFTLAGDGWVLRSGHAEGADQAFEKGSDHQELYLAEDYNEASLLMAAKYHPSWAKCGEYARKLHARNCYQILGRTLDDPSRFVCCWTPDGSLGDTTQATGGTGQALRIAKAYKIPIFNLALAEHLSYVKKYLKERND